MSELQKSQEEFLNKINFAESPKKQIANKQKKLENLNEYTELKAETKNIFISESNTENSNDENCNSFFDFIYHTPDHLNQPSFKLSKIKTNVRLKIKLKRVRFSKNNILLFDKKVSVCHNLCFGILFDYKH